MTVELRTLRVGAEFDATKYAAGMAQKVAADKAGAASSAAVVSAVSNTQAKVSQAGDLLARLSRQYVDGYASAQKMTSAVNQLSRGIETGKIQMSQASAILDGIARKYGAISSGAEFAARGQIEFAQAISATNARLSAQTAAATHAGTATARLNVAANRNTPGGSLNTANIAAQFQDIGITSAMGMSPLQIALQQGTQLQAVLGPLGVRGAVTALASAFTSLINPVSLVVLGLTAAVAAGIQFGSKLLPEVKSLEDATKDQLKAVMDLAEAYGIAGLKAEDFGKKSIIAAEAAARRDTEALRAASDSASRAALGQLTTFVTPGRSAGGFYGPTSPEFKAFNEAIQALNAGVKAGRPDFEAFEKSVSDVVENNPGLQTTGDKILAIVAAAAAAAQQLSKTDQILKDINRSSVGGQGSIDRLREQGQAQTELMRRMHPERFGEARNPVQEEIDASRRQQAQIAEIMSLSARSPAQRENAARLREAANVRSGEREEEFRDRVNAAGKLERARAEHELAEAQIERGRALESTIASSRLDLELIGKTTGEQAALRMEFEKTQELRQQAAQNGIEVDQKELDLIHQKAVEYGKLAEAIQRANLMRDIQFEREQMMRSPGEQAIASRLRGTGLGQDSDEANQLRFNQEYSEVRDGVRGFFGDISDALVNGGDDIGKALAQAVLGGLNKILDKLLDDVLNQLANSITGALMGAGGASGGGGLLGDLFGAAVGGGSSGGDPWAGLRGSSGKAGGLGYGVVPDNVGAGVMSAAVDKIVTGSVKGAGGGLIESYIRQAASIRGIDPNIAVRVAKSEGGLSDPFRQAEGMMSYGREESYGPFQLHMRNGGVGTRALAAGIDPRTNWKGGVDYGLNEAAQKGWGQWFGAAKAGIGNRAGLSGAHTAPVGAFGRDDGMLSLKQSEQALGKLSHTTDMATKDIGDLGKVGADATKGLGEFGSGLEKMASGMGGSGGGGGGGSFLSKLFGGLGGGGGGGLGFDGFGGSNEGPGSLDWLATGGWHSYHTGGVAGVSGGSIRRGIDPRVFIGAPRYHSGGIAGDEVPAILRRGEPVFKSMDHARQAVGGSKVTVNVINNAGVAVETKERQNPDGSVAIDVMVDRIVAEKLANRGTASNNQLRRGFGAKQTLKSRS